MQACATDDPSESHALGLGAIAGGEVWQEVSSVRLKLGPLDLETYLDFLPSGRTHRVLRSLTQFFSGDELDFELPRIWKPGKVPRYELGAEGESAPRLG